MPELGEVEISRQNLVRWWQGKGATEVLTHDPEVLTRGELNRLESVLTSRCEAVCRRGKYLWAEFADANVVFHYRMTGKITREPEPEPRFARLAWRVDDAWLVFKDSRRLGHIEIVESDMSEYPPVAKLGPEPHDLTGEQLRDRVGARTLKHALLDQRVVAGVGNIAITEVFFELGIAPDAHAQDLDGSDWEILARGLVDFFDRVVAEHAADEIEYVNTTSHNPFKVYRREGEPCPVCETPIRRTRVASRSSYFCEKCQR